MCPGFCIPFSFDIDKPWVLYCVIASQLNYVQWSPRDTFVMLSITSLDSIRLLDSFSFYTVEYLKS